MSQIQLSEFIQQHDIEPGQIILALSGGLDSMVLLELLAQQRKQLPKIQALHINHQLQSGASKWAEFCQEQCRQRDIAITVLTVDVDSHSGEGVEAAARKARYQALADLMQPGDLLLTGHHADDQAETLLLQLFRGAGVDGTAAMPALKRFAAGYHARPLLGISRDELRAYGQQQQLQWVEDPSNEDTRFDRNYLRQTILPQLQQRWPALTQTLSRVALNHAETQQVLNGYLDQDLLSYLDSEGRLRWPGLVSWSAARQGMLLRNWIKQQGHKPPSRKVLERIQTEMFTPREDAMPQVSWGESIVRRYRDHLYLEHQQTVDVATTLDWNPQEALNIAGLGSLHMAEVATGGLPAEWLSKPWQVRFRQGGEVVQRAGESHHLSLKKLFQEAAVPPWQRDRLPLLYYASELVFIPGVFQKTRRAENQAGILPVWQPFSTMN